MAVESVGCSGASTNSEFENLKFVFASRGDHLGKKKTGCALSRTRWSLLTFQTFKFLFKNNKNATEQLTLFLVAMKRVKTVQSFFKFKNHSSDETFAEAAVPVNAEVSVLLQSKHVQHLSRG